MFIEAFHERAGCPDPVVTDKLPEELSGEPALIARLLHLFQVEAQKDMDSLEAALETHDSCKVVSAAHRLKGSAATVGAEPLRAEAAQIEAFGREGRLQQAWNHMPDLRHEFKRFGSFVSELHDLA